MTIYEIDEKIAELLSMVNPDTGELVTDFDAVEALQMEREQKIENLACAYKNHTAAAKAIKAEADSLTKRAKAEEAKAQRAKDYLAHVLQGEKFKSPKVSVSYTKSRSIEPDEGFIEWAATHADNLLRYKAPEPDKTAIKALIDSGEEIPHVEVVEKVSVTVR